MCFFLITGISKVQDIKTAVNKRFNNQGKTSLLSD